MRIFLLSRTLLCFCFSVHGSSLPVLSEAVTYTRHSNVLLRHREEKNVSICWGSRAPQESFTIKDFELGKIYGVGSYSKVVRAKKKDTGKVYALKIMDKKFITKENKTAYVKLERIVLDQLDHPGIVRLFFTFQDALSLYMALESCEGGELFDQITRKGRLSEDETRFYAAEVVDALEYIHKLGLLHRDIKPENLLLSSDGHIKIADFGSVKPMQVSSITVLPNAASDDKACTFVGTAAYVPPEVLNSSPATVGNDLWALGCTLYQMLAGTSPFKDASEWLTFQRIIARDLRFPDYFCDEAKDLIDRLLDVDPSKRPGAGPDGYASIKNHPFFKGIDWDNLKALKPPPLALLRRNSSRNLSHAGDTSERHTGGNGESAASITRLASIDSFDSKWQQFLEPNESILMISMVKKHQTLTSKKVQLILTNKPKLFYVNPLKLEAAVNIVWSDNPNELSVQVVSPTNFKICTPKKILSFEDAKQRALHWKKAIEALQDQ
ncbi:Non-specific serine/threonine protein kinase [Heracleum sosnowskyi]|uniref:non-specific serine/threonine protein kinase n=1 Tax=Heracleum sosnowskyi TaxID=360622 RepID=A0AAD8M5M2_9APIA|nr:Non-specific serine/threonine protein kinase [Heracleum sosnowskyi]